MRTINLTNLRDQGRQLLRWCLDHPPQTVLCLMVFVMLSSYINFWLAWFALGCFFIGSIGLIGMMLYDIVRDERAWWERERQQADAQRQGKRHLQAHLAALRAGKLNGSSSPPPERQSDQNES